MHQVDTYNNSKFQTAISKRGPSHLQEAEKWSLMKGGAHVPMY